MADPSSQANYLDITSTHIYLDWNVDFIGQVISGSVLHTLEVKTDNVGEVIFDTGALDVKVAEVDGKNIPYNLKPSDPVMGSALHIPLPPNLKTGDIIKVKVIYNTTAHCTALQWLDKEQTQGKQFPYLFSQCQSIYARTLAPLQDTPSVKIKYSAAVRSFLPVLMSAIRVSPSSDGPPHDGKVFGKDIVTYTYDQPIPIPSYLIAIAGGNILYRPFPQYEDKQWKTGVWAEPETIDKAYWEFSEDTAKFLAAEEKRISAYRFGVYDLLVLPPSFPYGGMENACLSFLTPTLITGDRTLVDVVVHELTHSWFGNGVTHANASHFWLNEGWTTYIERVLQQDLHSPETRDFAFIMGTKAMTDALKTYEDRPKYQRLIIKFEKGEDPEDAYSNIPYEKGANLLLHLERTLGGLEVFMPYVKNYVNTYMGKSITTDEWKSHLYSYFSKHGGEEKIKALDSVEWDAWFYGEGLELPVKMEFDLTLAKKAYRLSERWNESRNENVENLNFKETDLDDLDSNQIVVFLERLQSYDSLPSPFISHLASLYKVSTTPNAEIRLRFYKIALADPPSQAAKKYVIEAAKWVVGDDDTGVIKGRMKYCRPTFKAISKIDRNLAIKTFEKHKQAFHPVARKLIEKDLAL